MSRNVRQTCLRIYSSYSSQSYTLVNRMSIPCHRLHQLHEMRLRHSMPQMKRLGSSVSTLIQLDPMHCRWPDCDQRMEMHWPSYSVNGDWTEVCVVQSLWQLEGLQSQIPHLNSRSIESAFLGLVCEKGNQKTSCAPVCDQPATGGLCCPQY